MSDRPSDAMFRLFGVDPEKLKQEQEQTREATRLELTLHTPEPDKRREPTIQGPGMGGGFVNTRAVETPEQRQTRLARDEGRSREPEPPTPEQTAERIKQMEQDRPGRSFLERELLPPWDQDPRR